MNHSFLPSQLNILYCSICKKDMLAHTKDAVCEACKNVGEVNLMYGTMLMCSDCVAKEQKLQSVNNTPEAQAERVAISNNTMNAALAAVRQADESISVKSDIFNAETHSILEIQNTIQSDESITNKPYELAKILTERFNHFKQVIFDLNKEIVDAGNKQRAIQVYLNNLANQLRAEEREKLKIQDINYKPSPQKIVKPKTIKTGGKVKIDKTEVRKYAQELGIGEHLIQMLCISKNINPEAAANMLRRSIAEAKSESV